ncbi:MAG: hypothetical protein JRH20_21590 [Deltaproteobacteria bacterium]|nr:hypothetical protein [Deltaproteobacteria bacterium]
MRRVIAFVVLGFLLITLLGALLHAFGVRWVSLDVGLIIVLHVAMLDRRGGVYRAPVVFGTSRGLFDIPGVVTALALGYCADVIGGGLKGIHSLELGAAFLVARLIARQVYLSGGLSQSFITFGAALLTSALTLGVRWLVGVPPTLATFGVVVAQASLTALVAPPVMRLLRFIDARIYAEPADSSSLRLR